MCGRFTLTVHQLGDVVEQLDATIDPELLEQYRPRYNVAPGEQHWLLRSKEGRRQVIPADWGLINHWATDPRIAYQQINARAETLAQRPAYRDAYQSRRCIIPGDGFFEWRGPKGAREPMWFHPREGGLLLFAGLYEGWTDPETGEVKKTFTIVTTEPNQLVAEVHDRMPAIVSARRIDDWLEGAPPADLLGPAPDDALAVRPASPRLNRAGEDDPDVLDPDDPKLKKQMSLF